MTRSGKQKGKRTKGSAPRDSGARGRSDGRGAAGGAGDRGAKPSWFAGKGRAIRFVLVFGVLICSFNAYFCLSFKKTSLFDWYLRQNAGISALVLRAFGDDATASGTSVASPRFSMQIRAGCDAIQASAFFVFAVLASPVAVPFLIRLRAVAIGTALLLFVNLTRLVSLYYTGVYFPNAFETMHVEVWQAGFIFLPIFLWLMWLRRVMRKKAVKPDVSA